jgi:hypothetical protein
MIRQSSEPWLCHTTIQEASGSSGVEGTVPLQAGAGGGGGVCREQEQATHGRQAFPHHYSARALLCRCARIHATHFRDVTTHHYFDKSHAEIMGGDGARAHEALGDASKATGPARLWSISGPPPPLPSSPLAGPPHPPSTSSTTVTPRGHPPHARPARLKRPCWRPLSTQVVRGASPGRQSHAQEGWAVRHRGIKGERGGSRALAGRAGKCCEPNSAPGLPHAPPSSHRPSPHTTHRYRRRTASAVAGDHSDVCAWALAPAMARACAVLVRYRFGSGKTFHRFAPPTFGIKRLCMHCRGCVPCGTSPPNAGRHMSSLAQKQLLCMWIAAWAPLRERAGWGEVGAGVPSAGVAHACSHAV